MKLSEYAKKIGVSYRTAWNYFRAGKLNAYQTHTGTVIVREKDKPTEGKVAVLLPRVVFRKQNGSGVAEEEAAGLCSGQGISSEQRDNGSRLGHKRHEETVALSPARPFHTAHSCRTERA
ncbi:MAG: hypothetical protein ABSA46_18890 [Thermodesulfovibrionales bacterium]